jgi:uncharacterized protein (TIGR02001 family)
MIALAGPSDGGPLAGDLTLVSDYRYRGVSLSDDRPALQADLTYTSAAGFYANAWTSTIAPYGGARHELDLTLGRQFTIDGFAFDAAASAYTYPGAPSRDYLEIPVSLSRTFGAWTWSGGAAYAPAQRGTFGRANTYAFLKSVWKPARSPISFTATFGHEDGGFAHNKLDWSLAATAHVRAATLSLAYVGFLERGTKDTLVASVGVGF